MGNEGRARCVELHILHYSILEAVYVIFFK